MVSLHDATLKQTLRIRIVLAVFLVMQPKIPPTCLLLLGAIERRSCPCPYDNDYDDYCVRAGSFVVVTIIVSTTTDSSRHRCGRRKGLSILFRRKSSELVLVVREVISTPFVFISLSASLLS
jgi:hypothetical protein